MKVHKIKLGSRPIISLSGTALYGLGVWLNNELQPLIKKIDSYVSSSRSFKDELLKQQPFGKNARFFTADAVGMYNNIDTKHALEKIKHFFQTHPLCFLLNWKPLYAALEIIMTCNVFQFSDYFFLQISRCSMDTPPAPPYAILYFAIKELELAIYKIWLRLYYRYIDDIEGVWLLDDDLSMDGITWQSFQDCMNDYGKLKWEFTERSREAIFLDLQLNMDKEGEVTTKIHEKAMNLYLYLPPHSAHAPGVLKGLIFGTIHRIFVLTNNLQNRQDTLQRFHIRLIRRGYKNLV